jgi:hypothetical protein
MRYAVLGLCLFATACAGSDAGAPTAPSSPPGEVGVTEATRGSELPFRGTLESIEVHTGAFPILHSVLTGTGQATHLGRYTVGFVFDITIGVGSPSTSIGTFRSQRPTETVWRQYLWYVHWHRYRRKWHGHDCGERHYYRRDGPVC